MQWLSKKELEELKDCPKWLVDYRIAVNQYRFIVNWIIVPGFILSAIAEVLLAICR